jgi:hypothetical protein
MYALIALLYLAPQAKGAVRGSSARDRSGNPFLSEARKRLERIARAFRQRPTALSNYEGILILFRD